MVSILACHAVDQGSIPRLRGGFFFKGFMGGTGSHPDRFLFIGIIIQGGQDFTTLAVL